MMSPITSQGLPKYDKPPVIEVVCGILFRSIEDLLAPHLGLLWEKFRPEYSTCQEVPPIAPTIEHFEDSPQQVQLQFSNKPPLPRIWFLHPDGSIIQVQRDRFLYNWKKMRPEDKYPHYSEVVEKFKNHLSSFQGFLKEQELGVVEPLQYEMTYVNLIPEGEAWQTTSDTGAVFPDFTWQPKSPRGDAQRFLSLPEGINWRTSFVLPNNMGRLHVHIQKGQLRENGQQVFRFELTARGIGENKSLESMPNWFDFAHESIVRGFADLTGYQVQRDVWKLSEG
jgi:uncharacterized protein (TIGR04255 family)